MYKGIFLHIQIVLNYKKKLKYIKMINLKIFCKSSWSNFFRKVLLGKKYSPDKKKFHIKFLRILFFSPQYQTKKKIIYSIKNK